MRVLIVHTIFPFETTPERILARELEEQLLNRGHDAEILSIPFKADSFTDLLSQMMMVRTFEITHVDRVIALDFPAYLTRHANKVLWILALSLRTKYLVTEAETKLLEAADLQALNESKQIFISSKNHEDMLPEQFLSKVNLLSPALANIVSTTELSLDPWHTIIERLLS